MKNGPPLSPCCKAKLWLSRGDGVTIGTCSGCNQNVARINPKTGVAEWLDGQSPWTITPLQPIWSAKKQAKSARRKPK